MKRFWAVPLATVLACCVGLGVVSAAEVEPTPQFDPPAQQQTPPSGTQPYYPVTPAPATPAAPAKPAPKQSTEETEESKPLKLAKGNFIYTSDLDLYRSVKAPENKARVKATAHEYSYNMMWSPLVLARLPLQLALDPQVLEKDPELRRDAIAASIFLLLYADLSVIFTPIGAIPASYWSYVLNYTIYEYENTARRQAGFEEIDYSEEYHFRIMPSPEETLEGMSSDWQQLQKKYSQTADLSDIRSAFETSDVLESVREGLEDFDGVTGLDELLDGNSLLSNSGLSNR